MSWDSSHRSPFEDSQASEPPCEEPDFLRAKLKVLHVLSQPLSDWRLGWLRPLERIIRPFRPRNLLNGNGRRATGGRRAGKEGPLLRLDASNLGLRSSDLKVLALLSAEGSDLLGGEG